MSDLMLPCRQVLKRLNRRAKPLLYASSDGKENMPEEPVARFNSAMARVRKTDTAIKKTVARLHAAKAEADASQTKAREIIKRLEAMIDTEEGAREAEKQLPTLRSEVKRSEKLSNVVNAIGDELVATLKTMEKRTSWAWTCSVVAEAAVEARLQERPQGGAL